MRCIEQKNHLMTSLEPVTDGVRCRSLVLGLGATGLSLTRFLLARGDVVMVADTRTQPPALDALKKDGLDVELALGEYPSAWLGQVDRLLVSPGVSLQHPVVLEARKRGLPVANDIGLFSLQAREEEVPLAAVTGSNGKSTVTTMLAAMLENAGVKVRTGGNLGTPALELLTGDTPDMYLLDLSSFQLDLVSGLQAKAAAILNITADHMDRYENLSAYAASKARILEGCEMAVINRDDPQVMALIPAACNYLSFGLGVPEDHHFGLLGDGLADRNCFLARGQERLLSASELMISGRHNLANALAALALAEVLALPMESAVDALRQYSGLPHRTELVAEQDGIRWVDDSKGTNVGATVAAVDGLQGPILLIAGGQAKQQDFSPLSRALTGKARSVILLGQDAALMEGALASVCPVSRVADMKKAVEVAQAKARRGDTVLLSPACGSQDMFADFAERGRLFADEVRRTLA